jgi:hypothetical protein
MPTENIPALPDALSPRTQSVESKLSEARAAIAEADRKVRKDGTLPATHRRETGGRRAAASG